MGWFRSRSCSTCREFSAEIVYFFSDLPIPPVHFIDYPQLQLPRLISGKGAGQKLPPPFQ